MTGIPPPTPRKGFPAIGHRVDRPFSKRNSVSTQSSRSPPFDIQVATHREIPTPPTPVSVSSRYHQTWSPPCWVCCGSRNANFDTQSRTLNNSLSPRIRPIPSSFRKHVHKRLSKGDLLSALLSHCAKVKTPRPSGRSQSRHRCLSFLPPHRLDRIHGLLYSLASSYTGRAD